MSQRFLTILPMQRTERGAGRQKEMQVAMSSQILSPRMMATMIAAMLATPVRGQSVTLDPQGSGPVTAALGWIQGTLLGSVATAVAVIAVAGVGLLMLTGRMNWRYGASVIIGLFILFGAGAIVAGIRSVAGGA